MIVSLTGKVQHLDDQVLVLEVSGVGYELNISTHCSRWVRGLEGDILSILVRMVVREDSISLYGFYSADERLVFDRLCTIAGVGPKLALAILSRFTPFELEDLVRKGDETRLNEVVGVGKKMATRLMIELRSIFDSISLEEGVAFDDDEDENRVELQVRDDIANALVSLGFTREEIQGVLVDIPEDMLSSPDRALSFALKQLGGGFNVGSRSK